MTALLSARCCGRQAQPFPDGLAEDIFGSSPEKIVKANLKQVVTGRQQSRRCGNGRPYCQMRDYGSSREPWLRTPPVRSGPLGAVRGHWAEEKDPGLLLEPGRSPFSELDGLSGPSGLEVSSESDEVQPLWAVVFIALMNCVVKF